MKLMEIFTFKPPLKHSGLPDPLHPQLVGLGQHHLEHGHEGGGLAEVAAADDVRVDVEALGVGPRLDGPHNVVKSTYDGGGKLQRNRHVGVNAHQSFRRNMSNRKLCTTVAYIIFGA